MYSRSSGGSGLRSVEEAIWGELTSGCLGDIVSCGQRGVCVVVVEDVLDGRRGRIGGR